jgi:1,2-phenylacetyl-CoA epoxidase PaaB subunit
MKRKPSVKPDGKTPSRGNPWLLDRRTPHGMTHSQFGAAMLVEGLVPHAVVAREWDRTPCGPREKMDLTFTVERIGEMGRRVSAGDLSHAETLLTAQTVTLNAVFANLAARAVDTTGAEMFERHLRLAFKAQSQCRATCETLALLKNPPVFTRQANVAAQQVVNNATVVTASRARETETAPNELSEAHAERLDGREAGQPGRRHLALAAVGEVHRPEDRRR